MPVITSIETCKRNKARVNIYVDGEFFAAAFLETVLKCKIDKNVEVNEEKLKEIITKDEIAKASVSAVNYLSRYVKTEKEVKQWLNKKGYSEETCEVVLNKLRDYGYVSDSNYAKNYKEAKEGSTGKKLIKLKLVQKGVSKELVDELEFTQEKGEAAAFKLAAKYLKNKEITKETVFKMQNYLYSKGFSQDEITPVVRKYLNGEMDICE